MLGWNQYHNLTKKYAAVFGNLFNDIYIYRQDANGVIRQTVRVPLAYGPRDKFLARVTGEPEFNNPIATSLPRLGFQLVALQYDPSRKLNTRGEIQTRGPNIEGARTYFNPVPYNLMFELYIMTRTIEDGSRIIEQILPFFTPEWTFTANLLDTVDSKRDIQVVLNSVVPEDVYDGNFEQRRALTWTLSFTMKAWFIGPVKEQRVIRRAITNFNIIEEPDFDLVNRVEITPGQTVDGEATRDPNETVAPEDVDPTLPYDFIIEYTL